MPHRLMLGLCRHHGDVLSQTCHTVGPPAPKRTLADLARNHHMSTSTLNRFFRQQMNQSVHQYLTQIRIGHACADLIQTDKPINLIADQSGFNNLSNFNRLFKRAKGVTPVAFRNAYQSQRQPEGFRSQLAGSG